jgi:homoserine dehydrogenase
MRLWRIGFAGFGNVNRALLRLLEERRGELLSRHGLEFRVTLVATRRRGALVKESGLTIEEALDGAWSGSLTALQAIREAPVDLIFEGTTLDPVAGEPATSHVRAALERGVSVVSANKGPLAFAARDLLRLARRQGAGFRFESSVADCLPVFDLFEAAVPVGGLIAFSGVLNSTSNLVLQAVARGERLEDAVREAQRQGIAEADPSNDLDGWDQAVKAVIVSNVLFGADLRPRDVERTPLSAVDLDWLRMEERRGSTVRLCASGGRGLPARVAPRSLVPGSFLATLGGGSLGLELATELAGTIQVASSDPGVPHTAYGMLTDLVAIHQGRLVIPSPLLEGAA